MTARLAERLRDETRGLHTEVERSALMRSLLHGELSLAGYCLLLRSLHAIYVTLEAALVRHATDVLLAPIFNPALFRSDALARDLDTLHGASWPRTVAVQPAARLYEDRLRLLSGNTPAALVAHAYVRYLGDLSGGQLLKPIVAKGLQLPSGVGTAFYDFGDADQTRDLTRAFRVGLDDIDVNEALIDAIVSEARQAFELHGHLFHQLAMASGLTRD